MIWSLWIKGYVASIEASCREILPCAGWCLAAGISVAHKNSFILKNGLFEATLRLAPGGNVFKRYKVSWRNQAIDVMKYSCDRNLIETCALCIARRGAVCAGPVSMAARRCLCAVMKCLRAVAKSPNFMRLRVYNELEGYPRIACAASTAK
jgi:hypothetical protein